MVRRQGGPRGPRARPAQRLERVGRVTGTLVSWVTRPHPLGSGLSHLTPSSLMWSDVARCGQMWPLLIVAEPFLRLLKNHLLLWNPKKQHYQPHLYFYKSCVRRIMAWKILDTSWIKARDQVGDQTTTVSSLDLTPQTGLLPTPQTQG